MNLNKRGLGRGLEALLADDSANEQKHQPVKDVRQSEIQPAVAPEIEKQTAMVVAFFKSTQKEHHALLEEAESLKKLLDELGDDLS
jgi:H2-forming N5,N10-methylenetetrahydromethanopterin dehydrogenase-like enzyme